MISTIPHNLRRTDEYKMLYARRKETIERVAKEKHGMRRDFNNCSCKRCKIRCHEPEEDGQLAVESAKNGLKRNVGEIYLRRK